MKHEMSSTNDLPLCGRRVLIVEDNYYLAAEEKSVLVKAGAEVVGPFARMEEALAAAERIGVDAAVIDINLGAGPSFGLAERLLAMGIPFVFATGYDVEEIPAPLRGAPRVEKPISERKLIAALEQLVPA